LLESRTAQAGALSSAAAPAPPTGLLSGSIQARDAILALAWVWGGFGKSEKSLILQDLLALGFGFGWLWAKYNSLILSHFLAFALALGATDSK